MQMRHGYIPSEMTVVSIMVQESARWRSCP